ncbi:hypothetical protein RIEGSTA812A_PEG_1034 [invertebrate metagenome]|uniref:Uncharacterized protein n=1 Tax=invertebrate metagenome TaxID=1711999 RepID=A0A484H7N5_9ZZZZ
MRCSYRIEQSKIQHTDILVSGQSVARHIGTVLPTSAMT